MPSGRGAGSLSTAGFLWKREMTRPTILKYDREYPGVM
jgi:hypothetical protein